MKSRSSKLVGWCRRAVLLMLVLGLPAGAVEVPTLFTAEVPIDEEADNPRADAYDAALREILMRVSGSAIAENDDAVAEMFPDPAAYVMQFRPGTEDSLWVSFDGEAIEQVLRNAGQTFWGAERPLTLVWLAVDWGQGTREIIAAGDPDRSQDESRSIDRNRLIRERLLEISERRGLPIVFPLLDTTDLQSVTFSDIWGGFDEAILYESERYDTNSILIGRIRPSSGQRSRWTYYFAGAQSELTGAPEEVVGQVADLLSAEFAVGGNAPIEAVVLHVSGVVSIDAYGSVHKILKDMSLIESFAVTEVAGDRVSYLVEIRGGADRLSRALRFGGLVEQEPAEPRDPLLDSDTLEFYFSP
ncbi:MAG: DUF2066 domain-containing protein [Woeseiaceae bacterium]